MFNYYIMDTICLEIICSFYLLYSSLSATRSYERRSVLITGCRYMIKQCTPAPMKPLSWSRAISSLDSESDLSLLLPLVISFRLFLLAFRTLLECWNELSLFTLKGTFLSRRCLSMLFCIDVNVLGSYSEQSFFLKAEKYIIIHYLNEPLW